MYKDTDLASLKCSHTTAYGISIYQLMIIRSHTHIHVRTTLSIRRARSKYADTHRYTFFYAEAKSLYEHI